MSTLRPDSQELSTLYRDEILPRLSQGDLEDIYGVKPRRWRGDKAEICCPLHEDDSPSAVLFNPKAETRNERTGLYCQAGCTDGHTLDPAAWLELTQGWGFVEAVRYLADLVGVDFEDDRPARRTRRPRPAPKPKQKAQPDNRIDASGVWAALATEDAAGRTYLVGRGLGAAVDAGLVRFTRRPTSGPAKWIEERGREGFRTAVPMLAADGRVVDLTLRWSSTDPTPLRKGSTDRRLPKDLRLPRANTGDGPVCMGSAPTWSPGPALVVEGATDTLAAQLALAGVEDAPTVYGLAGVGNWRRLVEAGLFRNRDTLVLLDADSAGREQSQRLAEAIWAQGGRPRIVALPSAVADLEGDLCDLLEMLGSVEDLRAELLEMLAAAAPFEPPPDPDPGPGAPDDDDDELPPLELAPAAARRVSLTESAAAIRQELAAAIETSAAAGAPVVLAVAPGGAGKTHAAIETTLDLIARGHLVALVMSNHAMIEEKRAETHSFAAERGLTVDDSVKVGALKACTLSDPKNPKRRLIDSNPAAAAGWKASMCARCDLRSTCQAHAFKPSAPVLWLTRAALEADDTAKAIADRVLIVDEGQELIQTTTFSATELRHLRADYTDAAETEARRHANDRETRQAFQREARRYQAVADLAELAADVARLASERRAEKPSKEQRYPTPTEGEDLAELLEIAFERTGKRPRALVSAANRQTKARYLRHAAEVMAGELPATAIPRADFDLLAAGLLASRKAAKTEAAAERAAILRAGGLVTLRVGETRDGQPTAAWGVRRLSRIPKARAVVILDATGNLADSLREAAAGEAWPTRCLVVEPDADAAAAPRLHIDTRGVSRGRILQWGRLTTAEDIAGAVETVGWASCNRSPGVAVVARRLDEALKQLSAWLSDAEHERLTVGLLTFKAVAQALEEGGPLARWRAAWAERGVHLTVGWYGRDHRASNAFEAVDAFVSLGDPVPNLGAAASDARLLGVPTDDYCRRVVTAELVQATWRPRGLRRAVPQLHIGHYLPIDWEGRAEVRKPRPGPKRSTAGRVAEALAGALFDQTGLAGGWAIPLLLRALSDVRHIPIHLSTLWECVAHDLLTAAHGLVVPDGGNDRRAFERAVQRAVARAAEVRGARRVTVALKAGTVWALPTLGYEAAAEKAVELWRALALGEVPAAPLAPADVLDFETESTALPLAVGGWTTTAPAGETDQPRGRPGPDPPGVVRGPWPEPER